MADIKAMDSDKSMAVAHPYIRLLVVAIGQRPDQAGGRYDHQNQRKYQQPYQNCADHTGCGDPHSDQDHREQNRSQYADQRRVQGRAGAIAWVGIPVQRCRDQQTQQIHDTNPKGNSQKNSCDCDQSGDLQECSDDTNNSTGDHRKQGTIAFTVT